MSRREITERVCRYLEGSGAVLFRKNVRTVERDPLLVSAVAAVVHLRDKFAWGVLPPGCLSDVMGAHAAQIACAVSGKYEKTVYYREVLTPRLGKMDNGDFVDLVCRAIAVGYADKWVN